MQNTSVCPQCGHFDQTKSVIAIAQGGYSISGTVDGQSVSGEARNALSNIFKQPKTFGQLQLIVLVVECIIFFPIVLMGAVALMFWIMLGNKELLGLARSFYTIIPDSDYQFALRRYNESLYCSRCSMAFHPQSGVKTLVSKALDEMGWNKYLYYGTEYGKIISGQ